MFSPQSMYLVGKMIQADRMKEAEHMRLVNEAKAHHEKERAADHSLGLNLAALTVIAIALTVGVFLTGCAQDELPASSNDGSGLPFGDELQATLEEGLADSEGVGLAVAVIAQGYDPWVGVGGVSHGNVPITKDSLFSVGSTTKNFTATTVLLLAEEGLLSLDDTINDWLDEYPNIDGSITIRQLLNHTSGIYNFTEEQGYWDTLFSNPEKVDTYDEILQSYVLEPYFPVGTGWHYSNSGYILLRMIIKKATGSSLSEQYRDRLWKPLGLEGMVLAGEEAVPGSVAHGWWDLDGDGTYDDLTAADQGGAFYTGLGGGVFSTAKDLAAWAQALFLQGQVLSEESLKAMLDFHSPTLGEPLVEGYGLGAIKFSPDLFNDLEILGHSGNAPGYAAGMLYLPEYETVIVILDNTERGEAMPTINALLSVITEHLQPVG
jgi:D-alanyl-D-alanine carboxypeptidase